MSRPRDCSKHIIYSAYAIYMMPGSEVEREEMVVATTIDLGGMNTMRKSKRAVL